MKNNEKNNSPAYSGALATPIVYGDPSLEAQILGEEDPVYEQELQVEAAKATKAMLANAMSEGKDTHLPAKLLGIAKGMVPAQNLWYTRAATDHVIFQNAQEALSPGYLANMRANSMKQFHQDWWWSPGEFMPERAPNMGNAFER